MDSIKTQYKIYRIGPTVEDKREIKDCQTLFARSLSITDFIEKIDIKQGNVTIEGIFDDSLPTSLKHTMF